MEDPRVSLHRCSTYEAEVLRPALETLLAPWGGMGHWVKPGDRVLLKPNLLTGSRPTKECTTRPALVEQVARLVLDCGGRPFLGDSPAFGTAAGVARANGLGEVAERLGMPILEFRSQRYATGAENFPHLRLSREALEADVVINLPKVKSHVQLTVTLGVKNLFGCVPGKMKAWWHLEAGKDADRFGEMLVETARAIAPDLTIVDGVWGHEGNGPSGGEPRFLGILGASDHLFALDRAWVALLGIDDQTVPTLRAAQRLGLDVPVSEITFPLCRPAELQVADWRLPDQMMPIDFALPRVVRSTVKHLYIRLIREPLQIYSHR